MEYTELQVTTNFSFLRGASHPEELVEQAALLGYSEIAITDRNTLAGVVRAHAAGRIHKVRIIPGCRLDLLDSPSLLVFPKDKEAYAALSNLLTRGNIRTEKGLCHLYQSDVCEMIRGSCVVMLPEVKLDSNFELADSIRKSAIHYKNVFGKNLYIGVQRYYQGDDSKYLYRMHELCASLDIPMVATNDVHYHQPERRELQDVLTCIWEKCTIHTAGYKLHLNAERYLKPAREMQRLFRHYPDAIRRTREIAEACRFSLDSLKYLYPDEILTEGRTALEELEILAWQGAHEHFGDDVPEKISNAIRHELQFIAEMDYAPYFLTVYDIVRFARSKGILCQGRGSAANSTICFLLGITSVNPTKFDLLFERFISAARNEPPDIDVDFEHERREEVMQYVFNKYGRDRAAIVATVTRQHYKGAVRDVAKAMGLSIDTINRLSKAGGEYMDDEPRDERFREEGFTEPDRYLQKVLSITKQYIGFPRQLGQHTGGFVITKGKLSDLCPILNARMEDRTCIEWNKDDIDALGFMKIDVLALGMLTCIRKAFDLAREHYGLHLTLANIPQDDPRVYDMICKADTIGVFQIESRAQQSMLPRLRPRNFYDLVIEVAIVRPGPIQGDMVHPYLRRRNGEEPVEYPSKELEEILGRTLGVPLFQEQAMKIAIVAAGFTAAEADELRRSMATFKAQGMVSRFGEKLTKGMLQRGYSLEYAQRVFRQLEGFGSYGFPESHAASFAQLVYISSWLKCFYPDVFACALLNSLPMGFYQPAQIVTDAKNHGVEVRPVDINYSNWDNSLEEPCGNFRALRLGFRHIKGLREEDIQLLIENRKTSFSSVHALRDLGLSQSAIEKLADADAFRSINIDRRQALWEITVKDHPFAIFAGRHSNEDRDSSFQLPLMSLPEHVVHDYASVSLSLKAHPVSFLREKLNTLHNVSTKELENLKNGDTVKVAGLVLVKQRPGTASGVCFMTIEDETGVANLVIFQNIFDQFRKAILHSRLIMVEGTLQRESDVIHVIVSHCYDISAFLNRLSGKSAMQAELFPAGRSFK